MLILTFVPPLAGNAIAETTGVALKTSRSSNIRYKNRGSVTIDKLWSGFRKKQNASLSLKFHRSDSSQREMDLSGFCLSTDTLSTIGDRTGPGIGRRYVGMNG